MKDALSHAWRATAGLGAHLLTHASADPLLAELRRGLTEADHVAEALLEGNQTLVPEPTPLDVSVLLIKMEPSLKLALGPGIALTIQPAESDSFVSVDAPTLDTIIRRLVDGTSRAIPEGGDLRITIGWWDCLSGCWPYDGFPPRRYVRLTLTSSGREQQTDAWWRVLEPEAGSPGPTRASIAAMVGRLDGCLVVESDEHEGTRVHVCFPASFNTSRGFITGGRAWPPR